MKILIITYYWPPSGGAGVQRWLKFAKYLPQFGIEPIVLTTLNGDYPAIDYSLLNNIPQDVEVIRTYTPTFGKIFSKQKSKAPYGSLKIDRDDKYIKKIAIWIRLNLVAPDARKVWNRYAFRKAKRILSGGQIDAIITTGPPHSTHLLGLRLKKIYNIRWIADFRDPWCDIDYLNNVKRIGLTSWLDRKLEQKVVNKCDEVISINKDILEKIGATHKGTIITNGYDEDDFSNEIKRSENFSIDYFGLISKERDPDGVILALNKLYDENIDDITLNFYGNVENKERLKSLAKHDFINFYDYIPHSQATEKMQKASILLLIINNISDNKGIITGKIFEYIGSKSPILALGPKDGEAAKILAESNSGKIFVYDAISEIAEYIKNIYLNGNNFISDGSKFSRKATTSQLVALLKTIL